MRRLHDSAELGRRLARAAAVACAAIALGVGVSACGSGNPNASANANADLLTVYSSLPLQGALRPISEAIVNGEKLALSEAAGEVGKYRINYVSLDDSNPQTGSWAPDLTSNNAHTAEQDKTAIAYIGELDSGATAISLPLLNEAGMLQLSPGSGYAGLTGSRDAAKGEPDRYYPANTRTFGRLLPNDEVQATALVAEMRRAHVHNLYILGDHDAFQAALANIVAGDAQASGINVVANDDIAVATDNLQSEAQKIAASPADAVFYGGDASPGSVQLWRAIHAAAPAIRLFGPNTLAVPAFTSAIGPAQRNTFLTSPVLPLSYYPPAAQRFLVSYRQHFRLAPNAYALVGYEAMKLVLTLIHEAGSHAGTPAAIVAQFFRVHNRDSVLGRYSIDAQGDTTLSVYGAYRVRHGRLVFDRPIRTPGAGR